MNYLRLHIWRTLTYTMLVRPIRISNLLLDQNKDDISVTFTLLDAPPRTGSVETPLEESSLDTVIERLTQVIDSNKLTFRGRTGKGQVTLRARADSLNVEHRSSETKTMSSGPRITGLWIGLILFGAVLGAVGGFFLLAKFWQ